MIQYNDILQTMNFSNSSINSYTTCAYQFKLTYLDKVPKIGNFWGDFGSFIHHVIEQYFKGKLEIWEMLDYYQKEFANNIKNSPPVFMRNAWNDYYDAGYEFFKNFDFDREEFEIVQLEDFIKGTDRGIGVVIKPDIIIKDKNTGEITILDFKTSEIKNKQGKTDQKKLDGYKAQLNLYAYFLFQFKDIEIKKAKLLFIRSNTSVEWDYDQYLAQDTLDKFIETAKIIQQTEKWPYNNSNSFFCLNLCSVSPSCEFRPKR